MNKQILQDIVQLKTDINEEILTRLPHPLRTKIRNVQDEILEIIKEAADTQLKRSQDIKKDSGIKKVEVE
jgi:hypothetical protein